jgi:hypothetical protein
MENQELYKVSRVFKNSTQRILIRKNLTLEQAQALVKSFPTKPLSMVVYDKQ